MLLSKLKILQQKKGKKIFFLKLNFQKNPLIQTVSDVLKYS